MIGNIVMKKATFTLMFAAFILGPETHAFGEFPQRSSGGPIACAKSLAQEYLASHSILIDSADALQAKRVIFIGDNRNVSYEVGGRKGQYGVFTFQPVESNDLMLTAKATSPSGSAAIIVLKGHSLTGDEISMNLGIHFNNRYQSDDIYTDCALGVRILQYHPRVQIGNDHYMGPAFTTTDFLSTISYQGKMEYAGEKEVLDWVNRDIKRE